HGGEAGRVAGQRQGHRVCTVVQLRGQERQVVADRVEAATHATGGIQQRVGGGRIPVTATAQADHRATVQGGLAGNVDAVATTAAVQVQQIARTGGHVEVAAQVQRADRRTG